MDILETTGQVTKVPEWINRAVSRGWDEYLDTHDVPVPYPEHDVMELYDLFAWAVMHGIISANEHWPPTE